jgi:hypothetical protein
LTCKQRPRTTLGAARIERSDTDDYGGRRWRENSARWQRRAAACGTLVIPGNDHGFHLSAGAGVGSSQKGRHRCHRHRTYELTHGRLKRHDAGTVTTFASLSRCVCRRSANHTIGMASFMVRKPLATVASPANSIVIRGRKYDQHFGSTSCVATRFRCHIRLGDTGHLVLVRHSVRVRVLARVQRLWREPQHIEKIGRQPALLKLY